MTCALLRPVADPADGHAKPESGGQSIEIRQPQFIAVDEKHGRHCKDHRSVEGVSGRAQPLAWGDECPGPVGSVITEAIEALTLQPVGVQPLTAITAPAAVLELAAEQVSEGISDVEGRGGYDHRNHRQDSRGCCHQ